MKRLVLLPLAAVLAFALAPQSQGRAFEREVIIGVLYPLTGPVAQVGIDAVAAVMTAVDIINNDVDLNVPLGPGKGLPNLDGAKIRVVVADHAGKPDVGQAEAERMITQQKAHALFGAYYSSVTATASQVAERYQIPYLNAESTSPKLTKRGFKWFFRTTPHDGEFTQVMFDFLADFQKKKAKILGKFEGSITSKGKLHVADGCKLKATVTAKEVSVEGRIDGNLEVGDRIEISQTGVVAGDIVATRMTMAEGASINGHCCIGPNNTQGAGQTAAGGKSATATETKPAAEAKVATASRA